MSDIMAVAAGMPVVLLAQHQEELEEVVMEAADLHRHQARREEVSTIISCCIFYDDHLCRGLIIN